MGVLLSILSVVGLTVLFLSFGLYFLMQLMCGTYYKTQNLKKRYNAQWALVTGSSSGQCAAPFTPRPDLVLDAVWGHA